MRLTIDASVAVKWIVDEPGSDKAKTYLPQDSNDIIRVVNQLFAPNLLALEVHNTLAKQYRKGAITKRQLVSVYPTLNRFVWLETMSDEIIQRAQSMSLHARSLASTHAIKDDAYPFNVYDCVYVAHAISQKTHLLTADVELARIARDGFNVPVEFISVP